MTTSPKPQVRGAASLALFVCFALTNGAHGDDSAEASSAKPRQDGRQSGAAAADFGMTPALARGMKGKVEEGSEEPDSLAAVVTRIDEKPYG